MRGSADAAATASFSEGTLRTLVIGRSPFADVVIAHASVAPHHAELVVTDDGRLYLTDCATEGGTWRHAESPDDAAGERWLRVRQSFVRASEALRLGEHRCTVAELVRAAQASGAGGTRSGMHGERFEAYRRRLRGRVERDPVTGEIVRRRL